MEMTSSTEMNAVERERERERENTVYSCQNYVRLSLPPPRLSAAIQCYEAVRSSLAMSVTLNVGGLILVY